MMRLKKLTADQMAVKQVEDQLFCCSFYGNTAFDAFFKDLPVLTYLASKIQTGYPKELDDDGNDMENQNLRRFYYQLTCHEIGRPKPEAYED